MPERFTSTWASQVEGSFCPADALMVFDGRCGGGNFDPTGKPNFSRHGLI